MNTITKEIDHPIILCITSNYWLRSLDKNKSGVDNNPGTSSESPAVTSPARTWPGNHSERGRGGGPGTHGALTETLGGVLENIIQSQGLAVGHRWIMG